MFPKPVKSTRGPSEHGEYDSVGDRERQEPSTPICETSAAADRWKTEETTGAREELEVGAEKVTNTGGRCHENPSLCADRETEPPGF